jgi:formylglycine-generating enzyme
MAAMDLQLPTEAEWEHAYRAGTTTAYSFGASITQQQANFASTERTVACGSLPANQWGLREMHGNVSEWCEDVYPPAYRVLRGGAWDYVTFNVRSSFRYNFSPDLTFFSFGFSVARAPSDFLYPLSSFLFISDRTPSRLTDITTQRRDAPP